MEANNTMASTSSALVEQIRLLDLSMAKRRSRLGGDLVSLRRAAKARLTSPSMMLGAFCIGIVLGRSTTRRAAQPAGREQPRHDAGLLERILVAIAVVRSWSPLLRRVAGWFDRPAKAPPDDLDSANPNTRRAELHAQYRRASCESPTGRQEPCSGTPSLH